MMLAHSKYMACIYLLGLTICLKREFQLLNISKYLGMSHYVWSAIDLPGIASFCSRHFRRNTLSAFKTVLYLHKIGNFFFPNPNKVHRNQRSAKTLINLE